MSGLERIELIEFLLQSVNMQVHRSILEKTIKAVDIVNETKGNISANEAIKLMKL